MPPNFNPLKNLIIDGLINIYFDFFFLQIVRRRIQNPFILRNESSMLSEKRNLFEKFSLKEASSKLICNQFIELENLI